MRLSEYIVRSVAGSANHRKNHRDNLFDECKDICIYTHTHTYTKKAGLNKGDEMPKE